jgi:hypothetical protein
MDNLRRLERGALGAYGYYEAVDYTPSVYHKIKIGF